MDKKKNKLSVKDFMIIVCSMIVLAILIIVIVTANLASEEKKKSLVESVEKAAASANAVYESSSKILLNEANEKGWIELYNPENDKKDLSGYVLYMNGSPIKKYEDGEKIDANSFMVTEIGQNPGPDDNNIISLVDADGKQVFEYSLPRLSDGKSYGRYSDGGIVQGYMAESKGISNEKAEKLSSDKLEFTVPGGFYDGSFGLEFRIPEGFKAYYTVDGTEPTTKSDEYTGAIEIKNCSGSNYKYAEDALGMDKSGYVPGSIDMGTVVRAILVDGSGNVVDEESASYFVGLKDKSSYRNLPVISIITNGDGMFDYFNGMYVAGRSQEDEVARGGSGGNSANYYNEWNRDAYIEYFEANKDLTYRGKASLSMIVDDTITLKQKSIKSSLEGTVWKGSSLLDSVSVSDNVVNICANGADNTYKVREYIIGKLLKNSNVGTVDLRPTLLFINGEYWGGYMLRAPYDETYISKHYGVKSGNIEFSARGEWNQAFNQLYDYVIENDMSVEENYEYFKSQVDISSFLDYICANVYISNASYSLYGGTAWRVVNGNGDGYEDGKWRWLMGDTANSLANKEKGVLSTYSIDSFLMKTYAKDRFFQSLLMNEEFRKSLGGAMTHLATDNFKEDKVEVTIEEVSDYLKKMAIETEERYYGNVGGQAFNDEIENINTFFENRGKFILGYTSEVVNAGGDINVVNGTDQVSENMINQTDEENGESQMSDNGVNKDQGKVSENNAN